MAGSTRADARVDLPQLKALIETLREGGVIRYCAGGVELVLGPPPAPKSKATKVEDDPQAARRAYYEQMLSRPVGDKELGLLP